MVSQVRMGPEGASVVRLFINTMKTVAYGKIKIIQRAVEGVEKMALCAESRKIKKLRVRHFISIDILRDLCDSIAHQCWIERVDSRQVLPILGGLAILRLGF